MNDAVIIVKLTYRDGSTLMFWKRDEAVVPRSWFARPHVREEFGL